MRQYTIYDVRAACFAEHRDDRQDLNRRMGLPIAPLNEDEQAMYTRAQEIDGRLLSCRRDSMQDDEKTILDWMTLPGGSRPSSDVILSEVYYNAHTGHIVWIAKHKESSISGK